MINKNERVKEAKKYGKPVPKPKAWWWGVDLGNPKDMGIHQKSKRKKK